MRRILASLVLVCAVVSAQDSRSFEVAAIRPASPQHNDVKAGVRIAGAQVRFVSMSLKDPLSGPLRDVGLTLESSKAPLSVVVARG